MSTWRKLGSKQAYRVRHQHVSMVSQCSLIAWLNGLASRDQRRRTAVLCSRWCAIQMATFSLLTFFTLLCMAVGRDSHLHSYDCDVQWIMWQTSLTLHTLSSFVFDTSRSTNGRISWPRLLTLATACYVLSSTTAFSHGEEIHGRLWDASRSTARLNCRTGELASCSVVWSDGCIVLRSG